MNIFTGAEGELINTAEVSLGEQQRLVDYSITEDSLLPITEGTPEPTMSEGISSDWNKRLESMDESRRDRESGEISLLRSTVNTAGALAGGAFDIGGRLIEESVDTYLGNLKSFAPTTYNKVADKVTEAKEWALTTDAGKAAVEAAQAGYEEYSAWKEANPQDAKTFEAVLNIGMFGWGAKGVSSQVKKLFDKPTVNTVDNIVPEKPVLPPVATKKKEPTPIFKDVKSFEDIKSGDTVVTYHATPASEIVGDKFEIRDALHGGAGFPRGIHSAPQIKNTSLDLGTGEFGDNIFKLETTIKGDVWDTMNPNPDLVKRLQASVADRYEDKTHPHLGYLSSKLDNGTVPPELGSKFLLENGIDTVRDGNQRLISLDPDNIKVVGKVDSKSKATKLVLPVINDIAERDTALMDALDELDVGDKVVIDNSKSFYADDTDYNSPEWYENIARGAEVTVDGTDVTIKKVKNIKKGDIETAVVFSEPAALTIMIPNAGELILEKGGKYNSIDGEWSIDTVGLSDEFKGKGLGVKLYLKAVEELLKKGEQRASYLSSGGMTTESAMRVWRSLYKNPDKYLKDFPQLKGAFHMFNNERGMIVHDNGPGFEKQYEQDIGSEPAYSIELYPDTYVKNMEKKRKPESKKPEPMYVYSSSTSGTHSEVDPSKWNTATMGKADYSFLDEGDAAKWSGNYLIKKEVPGDTLEKTINWGDGGQSDFVTQAFKDIKKEVDFPIDLEDAGIDVYPTLVKELGTKEAHKLLTKHGIKGNRRGGELAMFNPKDIKIVSNERKKFRGGGLVTQMKALIPND